MERWVAKLLGMGIGWVAKGPVGAILGGLLGAVLDETELLKDEMSEQQKRAVYHAYLVTLFVYIAKADGRISAVEVRIIRDFFHRKGISVQEMNQVKEALKIASSQKNVAIEAVVDQINQLFDYPTRYNILELCYHIAAADKVLSQAEQTRLDQLGKLMRISQSDQYGLQFEYGFSTTKKRVHHQNIEDELNDLKRRMKQNDHQQKKREKKRYQAPRTKTKTPWEILGVTKHATAQEVKKRYLKLAAANHPDKFSDPKEKSRAEERIKEINLAYQELKQYFR